MSKKLSIAAGVTLGLTMLVGIDQAKAALIVSPVGATATSEFTPGGEIGNTIDQSGLSIGFTSGVDDFDAYLGLNPIHSILFSGNEWFTNFQGASQTVTYDLGSVLAIDRLALWNEEGAGIFSFNILSSNDGMNFSTVLSGVSPIDNPPNTDYPAEVIDFGSVVNAQFVQFEITACDPNVCAIGEVAFATAETAESVPEPTFLLGLLAVGAFGATSLKGKQKQEK
ncbi:MAG: discoidin domain-containing protein [Okeania sp. SIO2G4]|uniref:discoidin domain-containing protein n=1 Tax=unclassified Okeania TaxID=2634635 RepID=UPI0013BB76D4|nr:MULTISPECIES: discoidin domain-containing protein [unclassified Okeania]NEP38207.1 discoidin domain-containing protein [Okeania sp. SIO2H7]NEP73089.1 discoidin domain-containing protein [Okeania sp. SIO2G5]NEP93977.1 discoidin domain-containing protein [Okeania sp. SIO2F5]NEQ93839.1 discoidin domain-containing protein [Okeania sp. SIO2G4]